ncbi:hypothetical protein DITRI_Ditri20bG0066900 [Diplodiscus trichospermus]
MVVSVIVEHVANHADEWITGKITDILGVEDEVKKISSNLSCIRDVLRTSGGSQQHDPLLRNWLKKLEKLALDAQNVLDTYQTEVALWKNWKKTSRLGKASFKSKLAAEIKDISKSLETIYQENERFNISKDCGGGSSSSSSRRSQTSGKEREFRECGSSSTIAQDDFAGRKDVKESLISQMISKRHVEGRPIHGFPIIGMSGRGKTALAQQIYKDNAIIKRFGEARMWKDITSDFDYEKFLAELTSFLNERERGDFLLVLDDVQEIHANNWMRLEKLLKGNCKKSILLFTTHNRKVATTILGEEPSQESYLPVLPDEDCMELFRRVGFPNGLPINLEKKYGSGIISKCKGIPLAVKAIAWVLRGNTTDERTWKNILENDIWELEQGTSTSETPNILPLLRLGYNHLDYILQQCFAYCSIFPKGYPFQKEELVKLWMAEGFIEYEETGEKYFNELLTKSFFEGGHDEVRYRLHDLMHEVAQSVSSPHCCQVKDDKYCHFSDESLHVSLLCEDVEKLVEQIVEKSKKLRTLLFPSSSGSVRNFGKAFEKLFKTLKCIRVLDLSSSSLEKLPESVSNLKLLRYLDLSNTKIRVLPDSICNLYNLQTLKLLGCIWLLELPKDLGKLVKLRHLELDDIFWYHCTKLPPSMGNATGLHNLHVFPVGNTSGHGIEELKDMKYLTGKLHISMLENAVTVAECKLHEKRSLEKVVLEWSEETVNQQDQVTVMDDSVLKELRPHSNLKMLEIHHFKGSGFPSWLIDGSLEHLVNLSLNNCTKCRTLSVGQLNSLTKLYIKGMPELEVWPEDDQCTSLRYLKLSNCPNLKTLPSAMPHLKFLKIKGCHSLQALPITRSLEFLILIDNRVLEYWQEVIVAFRVFVINGQGHFMQKITSLIPLIELKMVKCPKIPALPEFYPQKLEISGCELLTDLPALHSACRLQHLALEKFSNETILTKIQNTSSLCSLVLSSISNLRSLPQLLQLPRLQALYISACKELTSLSDGGSLQTFSSLKLLSVRGCSNLQSLPDDLPTALECLIIGSCRSLQSLGTRDMLKRLLSLKDMYIEDCPLLMSLPEGGLPNSLQHLLIQGCPELTAKCQKEGAEWPKIENVPDLEIDSPKSSLCSCLQCILQ